MDPASWAAVIGAGVSLFNGINSANTSSDIAAMNAASQAALAEMDERTTQLAQLFNEAMTTLTEEERSVLVEEIARDESVVASGIETQELAEAVNQFVESATVSGEEQRSQQQTDSSQQGSVDVTEQERSEIFSTENIQQLMDMSTQVQQDTTERQRMEQERTQTTDETLTSQTDQTVDTESQQQTEAESEQQVTGTTDSTTGTESSQQIAGQTDQETATESEQTVTGSLETGLEETLGQESVATESGTTTGELDELRTGETVSTTERGNEISRAALDATIAALMDTSGGQAVADAALQNVLDSGLPGISNILSQSGSFDSTTAALLQNDLIASAANASAEATMQYEQNRQAQLLEAISLAQYGDEATAQQIMEELNQITAGTSDKTMEEVLDQYRTEVGTEESSQVIRESLLQTMSEEQIQNITAEELQQYSAEEQQVILEMQQELVTATESQTMQELVEQNSTASLSELLSSDTSIETLQAIAEQVAQNNSTVTVQDVMEAIDSTTNELSSQQLSEITVEDLVRNLTENSEQLLSEDKSVASQLVTDSEQTTGVTQTTDSEQTVDTDATQTTEETSTSQQDSLVERDDEIYAPGALGVMVQQGLTDPGQLERLGISQTAIDTINAWNDSATAGQALDDAYVSEMQRIAMLVTNIAQMEELGLDTSALQAELDAAIEDANDISDVTVDIGFGSPADGNDDGIGGIDTGEVDIDTGPPDGVGGGFHDAGEDFHEDIKEEVVGPEDDVIDIGDALPDFDVPEEVADAEMQELIRKISTPGHPLYNPGHHLYDPSLDTSRP